MSHFLSEYFIQGNQILDISNFFKCALIVFKEQIFDKMHLLVHASYKIQHEFLEFFIGA